MRALPIAAIAAALVLSLGACSDDSDSSDPAACKKAVAERMKEGASASKENPSACNGLDEKERERIVKEIVEEQLKESGVPTDLPSVPTPDIDVPTPDLELPEVP
ncbi:hypothetical protein IHE55_01925 [Streptomyces pactum]|uniref:Secreted protein n=1 Tax=Streptomyces pactum TaxID=68249 RepID=A0ABS0NEK6_9ACTN|nr:hypothetical protein [Streptomyces pactum]MBH5333629.1 hypothetical protein [Streptomyces pactum]